MNVSLIETDFIRIGGGQRAESTKYAIVSSL
jgi:hypothetical protein